ncbi:MAG TPA: Coenzyme F420 hydrogenase/dehydrogenase, beta subunit C-terminal domain, partial [Candidatus Deferrimicrobiaceae bacterium]|nr:Coenzyme F420 hydrogenase/dehydrogenase, beta subunit C-terminal domain [Candidatus Deferrimicrobiaceae bacterium]
LAKGFKENLFDAAIVVRRLESYSAETVVAQNAEAVAAASGTKYLRVNVTAKLRELISQGKKRIAIVCTPCEAKAARKIQQNLKTLCRITVIGLFCFEAFNATKLRKEIQNLLNVNIDNAEKTQVRHGKFLVQSDGKLHSCRVKDLDSAAEKACGYCDDFTSRFADVSVGSVGSREGFSTVIVRSPVGEKMVEKLEAQREAADKSEVMKLAKFKQERSQKAFADQKKVS